MFSLFSKEILEYDEALSIRKEKIKKEENI